MRFRNLAAIHILATTLIAAAPVAAKVYQIGLIMAERNSPEGDDILNAATSAFFESRRFDVIERARLDKIFEERDLSDFINGNPGDLSTLEDVDVLGLITCSKEQGKEEDDYKPIYFIDIRLTNVKSGRIVGTVSSRRATFFNPKTPYEASRLLLESIRDKFPPEGYVVDVSGTQVRVDLGAESGIQEGDVLEIIRNDDVIFHPVTGKPLPQAEIVVGRLKVVDAMDELSTCKVKKTFEGNQVAMADRVRLVPKNQEPAKIMEKIEKWIPFVKKKKKKYGEE